MINVTHAENFRSKYMPSGMELLKKLLCEDIKSQDHKFTSTTDYVAYSWSEK